MGGSGEALPSGAVGEEIRIDVALKSCDFGVYTEVATVTLTTGVWLLSACAGIFSPGTDFTESIQRLNIKGVTGTDTTGTLHIQKAGRSMTTFANRIVVVASGDADKTVDLFINANGSSNSNGRGSISAIRIA